MCERNEHGVYVCLRAQPVLEAAAEAQLQPSQPTTVKGLMERTWPSRTSWVSWVCIAFGYFGLQAVLVVVLETPGD